MLYYSQPPTPTLEPRAPSRAFFRIIRLLSFVICIIMRLFLLLLILFGLKCNGQRDEIAVEFTGVSETVVTSTTASTPSHGIIKALILEIEHAVNGNTFRPRSKFTIQFKTDGKQSVLETEKNGIFGNDLNGFKSLLNNNDLYRIRVHSNPNNASSPYITSAIPAVSKFVV